MSKTPRFTSLIDQYSKMLSEDSITPNLTGNSSTGANANTNPNATPPSQNDPQGNAKIDPEKTRTLLAQYTQLAQQQKVANTSQNPSVPQTPTPGQGPTNGEQPTMTYDDSRMALYRHLVDELGLKDEIVQDIFRK